MTLLDQNLSFELSIQKYMKKLISTTRSNKSVTKYVTTGRRRKHEKKIIKNKSKPISIGLIRSIVDEDFFFM